MPVYQSKLKSREQIAEGTMAFQEAGGIPGRGYRHHSFYFMSIIAQAAHDRLPHSLYLFYSNYRPEDAPFLDFLRRLEKENPDYHFIPTMTEMEKSRRPWNGERGYVDSAMLIKYLNNLNGPIYYLAGPPAMVTAMRKMLLETKVDEDDIRIEEFAGY